MSARQVTIIDELWDNEELNSNRRLYDERERVLQRQNIELNDRLKKFEKQLESVKQNATKDHDKELIKRALAKQAVEYNKILGKKTEEIEQLNERIKQLSQSNNLEMALRQSNIERLQLEKRLLSSSNSTTTTNVGPTTTTSTSTDMNEENLSSQTSRMSSPSSIDSKTLVKQNEELKFDVQRLTQLNDDNLKRFELQLENYNELEEKYKQLLDIEQRYEADRLSSKNENKQLKEKLLDQTEKLESLENQLKSMKNDNEKDLKSTIEHLQNELDKIKKERDDNVMLNERLIEQNENLRKALIAKSDEFDLEKRENERLKIKLIEFESKLKPSDATDDNDMMKQNRHDEFEQFQKIHDITKREQQLTIHLLQEKINELERKTEIQASQYDEIRFQLNSLKINSTQRTPSLTSSTISINNHLPNMIDAHTSPRDDSAPIYPFKLLKPTAEKISQIAIAKYNYEPSKSSPNDHPEIELPLKQGEYYLIYGQVDEDGFYDGRNLEGRYGLIPSNFIELVKDKNSLPENVKYLINTLTNKIQSADNRSLSLNSDVSNIREMNSISSNTSTDTLSNGKNVPYPTNLHIDKSTNSSVYVAWNQPISNIPIIGYQVLLDHSLFTTIRTPECTRALIENINLNEATHRVSVRTITQHGLSRDQECTLLLTNKTDLLYMPTDLRIDRITQTSAIVSWWPASNNLIHKLYVNDTEVQTLRPGIYRFKLSGLLPNLLHKVMIKAKTPSSVPMNPQQKLTASIEFHTTSFDESVESPRHVQATAGQQEHTLVVSWEQPASINKIQGYRILIDGRQIQDVSNSSNHNVFVKLNPNNHGQYLTIRTLSDNGGQSRDSTSINIDQVLKQTARSISVNSHDRLTPIVGSPLTHSLINDKDTNRSISRLSFDSLSMTSSINGDSPQIELSSKTTKKTDFVNKNKNKKQTPTNDNSIESLTPTPSLSDVNRDLDAKNKVSPRIFVALFDYDPKTMSPNQNNDEELPFKQGQIIKIYGDQDADGFYIGQAENGRTGYVPSNMVSEIEADDLEKESMPSPVSLSTVDNRKSVKKMIAIVDSIPNENSKDELSISKGDIVYIHENLRDDDYYSGELENGKTGLIRSNYLKQISNENSPEKPTSETHDKKSPIANVHTDETVKPVSEPTEQVNSSTTTSLLDRFKTTFSWNLNEPI